ncbi:hypothetical protein LDENG_00176020 [Xyrichtys novacula]|uniref:Uncharacterized protein n=1 Tax=Xyrichtys novacula TaxID=13765 RepID=A0AAV1ENJ8_XYRNO|nr:hypothetical protein LDENG_00176020 [Xyrichtys novacula]
MVETNQAEGDQDQQPSEEELDEGEKAMLLISKYAEARRALPWDQWTLREKVSYYMDRLFLLFIVLFLLVIVGECSYKIWYVTNMKKITEFVSDLVLSLFGWLFTADRQEELAEL